MLLSEAALQGLQILGIEAFNGSVIVCEHRVCVSCLILLSSDSDVDMSALGRGLGGPGSFYFPPYQIGIHLHYPPCVGVMVSLVAAALVGIGSCSSWNASLCT